MRLEHRYRVRHGTLPIAVIFTHPQMRLTINEEGIEQLADNIWVHGLIHPISVADLGGVYVVISGHRRLLAYRVLEKRGYQIGEIAVVIFENLTAIEMALLQASENIHEQVPVHEAAKFYEATWRALKIAEPGFTLVDFAKAVGRSEQTIRSALRFVLLPQKVQEFVASGALAYTTAVQLTRLSELVDEAGTEQWAIRFVISKTKVPEARKQIDTHIRDVTSGQLSMLDVFEENVRELMEQDSRRILIDRGVVVSFWSGLAYLKRLLDLFENGKLDPGDSPWLRRNPRRAFRELIEIERRVLEHMRIVLSSQEAEEAECVLLKCESFIS